MTELVLKSFDGLRKGADRIASVWALILSIPLAVALVDRAQLGAILQIALTALAGTLPYIAVAVLLIAYLKASGAESLVARAFEGRETRMILLAALFGGLAPFCSCEVIPFIAGLLAVGAPLSAVMAFWLSSPLIDPPTVLITAGALGWEFAIGKTVAAVGLGLMGGFGVRFLMARGAFAQPLKDRASGGCCGRGPAPFQGRPVWRFWREDQRVETFRSEGMVNALFLIKWLSLAYLLEALLITYVPADAIGGVVGGEGLLPIVVGALVGAPAYLNGYAAPPLVAGLMEQGMTAGAAMAFMVAGAVSSIPAMAAVWSLVKRPVFFAYMGFGIAGAIVIGVGFQVVV
ncbi:MAG TPA: permease [Gammaproteobacteria bacterium]|nr:permease [Gammaproteobacteria bacterium]